MKKGLSKIISVFLVILMLIGSAPLSGFMETDWSDFKFRLPSLFTTEASAATKYKSGYYTYTVSESNATIIGCDKSISGDVVIPEKLDGYSVTTIDDSAFYDCTGLTSITIPDSVTSIGSSAFYGCESLTSVNISDISAWCNIKFESWYSNPLYYAKKLYINSILATNITIPDSVTSIGSYAFYYCTGLTSITIPDSVTSIGDSAFDVCTGLTSITIPDSVTSIGSHAFHHTAWYNAQPDGDVYAGKFYYTYKGTMPKNTSIVIKDGTKGIADLAFYEFYNCTSLTNITITDSVTSIGSSAFKGCTGLTNVTIPDSVTSIGSSAFSGCTGLTSVTIGNSVTSIGRFAFYDCTRLTSVKIGSGVRNIERYAFYNCTGLTSATIPNSVTSIEYGAFDGCYNLTDVYYTGTQEQWQSIIIDARNYSLTDANIHYNYIICDHNSTTSHEAVEATCTEDGYTAGVYCEDCQTWISGHDLIKAHHTDNDGDGICEICKKTVSDIVAGEAKTINVAADETVYLMFIPTASGTYTFKSISDSDTYGYLYDSDKNELTYNDDNDDDENFSITYDLEAGKTYYWGASYYSSSQSGSFDVKLTCDKVFCSHENTTSHEAVEATCTEDGYTAGVYCEDCQIWISGHEVIKAHHTNIVTDEAVSATCTAKGKTEGTHCSTCGDIIVAQTVVPAKGHNFKNYVSNANATCTKDGTKTAKCDRCDATNTITDVGSAKGHTEKIIPAVEATCTETGLTEGKKCSVCGEILVAQKVVSAKGHTKKTINAKTASCKESGYTGDVVCSVCNEVISKGKTVSKLDHKKVVDKAVVATCTNTGLTEGSHCSVCGEVIVAQTTISATGHNWGEWTTEKPATCKETGSQKRVCSVCKTTDTKTIAKTTTHSYKTITTKATLTKSGSIVTKCTVCGKVSKTTTIAYPKTISLSATSFTYTGKAIKPTVTVKDSKGKVVDSKYYTVSYKNNTNVGKATVTITFKGNYSGTKTLNFTIAPKQVTGLKVSSVKTTSLTLSWSKVTGAKYYKLEKSTDGKKWTTVTTTDKTSYTVKSLKAGTKYQFRVTALDSTKKIAGKSSAVLKTATLTGAPSVTLKSSKSKTATASWKKVTGASKYVVYKSTDGKKWTKVTTTTKTSYTFTKLTGGKKIYVKVTALNAYGKASAASTVKNVTVKK